MSNPPSDCTCVRCEVTGTCVLDVEVTGTCVLDVEVTGTCVLDVRLLGRVC